MAVPGSSRPPWWLLAMTACYLAYVVFLLHSLTPFGTQPLGIRYSLGADGLRVRTVEPRSPAAAADIRPGDRLVAVNGLRVGSRSDTLAAFANVRQGTNQLRVVREGQTLDLAARLAGGGGIWRLSVGLRVPAWVVVALEAVLVLTLAMGIVIAFKRPRDPVALLGAWFLASIGVATAPLLPSGTAATWRELPPFVGWPLWVPAISSIASSPILFAFAIALRRHSWPRWVVAVMLAPGAIATMRISQYLLRVVYRPELAIGMTHPIELIALPINAPAYVAAAGFVLVRGYREIADANERRRVRILVAGTGAAAIGSLQYAVALASPITLGPIIVAPMLFSALPLSFGYTILRHRLFDIRVFVRRGLQYALARGVLLAAVPGVAVLLAGDLWLHARLPLGDVLAARGWMYAGLVAVAGVAVYQRQRWLDAVDRRFFRERYDARRLLGEIVAALGRGGTLEEVADAVVERIAAAFHSRFVAIMARVGGDYRVLAIAPKDAALPPLAASSKLVGLLRVLGKPLEIADDTGWLKRQLPRDEVALVDETHLDLIVPIAGAPGRREAFLALGAKRSEEPYSSDDRDVLVTIATSLAILMDRVPAERVEPRAPEALAGRYRLGAALGGGGMGTVYDAHDAALDRRVAVKLIRPDLVHDSSARARFRQEAQVAARFAHPNASPCTTSV